MQCNTAVLQSLLGDFWGSGEIDLFPYAQLLYSPSPATRKNAATAASWVGNHFEGNEASFQKSLPTDGG